MIRPKEHLRGIHRTPAPVGSRLDAIRLDKNEFLPCWPEEWFREFMNTVRPEHFSIHPETGELHEKLAKRLNLPKKQILVTAGSDAAIRSAYEVFVSPGDEVVVPNPTFAMYEVYAKVFAARLVTVDYDPDLKLPIERLLKAIGPNTRVVAIANPNSPTGTVFSREELKSIIGHASSQGAAVLIDEAYYPFHSETMIDHVRQFDNLIVTRTLSKAAGVAGMRVGFAASSKEIAPLLFAVKPMYEITTVSALLGEYILDHYERIDAYAAKVREGRQWLSGFFRERGFHVPESHANFIHVDFGSRKEAIVAALVKNDVLFKEFFDHPALSRYCRFTIGPKSFMEQFADLFSACTGEGKS